MIQSLVQTIQFHIGDYMETAEDALLECVFWYNDQKHAFIQSVKMWCECYPVVRAVVEFVSILLDMVVAFVQSLYTHATHLYIEPSGNWISLIAVYDETQGVAEYCLREGRSKSAIFGRDEVSYENSSSEFPTASRPEYFTNPQFSGETKSRMKIRSSHYRFVEKYVHPVEECQGVAESIGRSKSAIFGRDEVSYENVKYSGREAEGIRGNLSPFGLRERSSSEFITPDSRMTVFFSHAKNTFNVDKNVCEILITIKESSDTFARTCSDSNAVYHPITTPVEKSRVEFLCVEYTHPDMKTAIPITIPSSYFCVGNELLSMAFVRRMLEYKSVFTTFAFDERYVITVIDTSIVQYRLSSRNYIVLESDTFRIVEIPESRKFAEAKP
jgi:hypothetical protein